MPEEDSMAAKVKFFFVFLACIPVVFGFAGGSQATQRSSGTAEPVGLSFRVNSGQGSSDYLWVKKLEQDLNVKIDWITNMDDETYNLALASGDLPDIITNNRNALDRVVNNGIARELTPLIDQYLPSLKRPEYASMIQVSKEFAGGPDKKLFVLFDEVGLTAAKGGRINGRGLIMRWDYFKEIGAPELKNDNDIFDAIVAMHKNHPATKSGRRSYGMGVERSLLDMGGYRASFTTPLRLSPWTITNTKYSADVITNVLHNGYTETDHSHYWTDMRFYNRLHRAGLFDPDSFSMNRDEYDTKVADGAYMALYYRNSSLSNTETKIDPQTKADFIAIHSPGIVAYSDKLLPFGNDMTYVPRNTKNWEKAVAVLNWLWDPDNIRLVYSGEKGVHWDYDGNGVPYVFDSVIQLREQDPAAWTRTGYGNGFITGGMEGGFHPDGAYYSLFEMDANRGRGHTAAVQDFMNHYGLSYPTEGAYKLVKAGVIPDYSQDYSQHIGTFITPALPMDIRRIIDSCNEIILRGMPRLIMANSDAEFNREQQQVLTDLRAANEQTAWEWVSKEYNSRARIIEPLFNQARAVLIK
jgi:ABC-type glycerol-3-phosphate transport system substrate-binding protein